MDDGILIEQLSSFLQLYAKSDARYKNNRLKENAWLTISQRLEESPEECKHRWKLLRNKYTGLKREHRNILSGSGATEISLPYFKLMGFLDKYLQTRKSYYNIEAKNIPESQKWTSIFQIIVNTEHENQENDSQDNCQENRNQINEEMENESDEIMKSCGPKSNIMPKRTVPNNRTILKRSNKNEVIPRHSIPTKRVKPTEALTEKMSGCFETFNKVLEKNISPISDEEHFVPSLVADMAVFSQKDKIILKKIYIPGH